MHYYQYMETPVGKLLLAGDGDSLTLLGFPGGSMARRHEPDWKQDPAPFAEVRQQLEQYFGGSANSLICPWRLRGLNSSSGSGLPCRRYPSAKPGATGNWPDISASRRPRGQWGQPMA